MSFYNLTDQNELTQECFVRRSSALSNIKIRNKINLFCFISHKRKNFVGINVFYKYYVYFKTMLVFLDTVFVKPTLCSYLLK